MIKNIKIELAVLFLLLIIIFFSHNLDFIFYSYLVNIDKNKGPTSHQIADYVKKILKINKAGHSGTLEA